MDNQACCAHCKVELKHIDNPDGTRSDYWECAYGCGARFVPVTHAKTFSTTMKIVDGIPRRCRQDLFTPAEKAISNAIQAVEMVGCDPLLTDAVVLLGQAKDKVADFVDNKPDLEVEKKLEESNKPMPHIIGGGPLKSPKFTIDPNECIYDYSYEHGADHEHSFMADGAPCSKCGKTVSELLEETRAYDNKAKNSSEVDGRQV